MQDRYSAQISCAVDEITATLWEVLSEAWQRMLR